MTVTAEFFGVPRLRTGVARVEVEAGTLGELLEALGTRFPDLAADCLNGDRLRTGYVANLNGERFTSDPGVPLTTGDNVLLLSADVGG